MSTPIQRLKQCDSDALSTAQAAEVLGIEKAVLYDLVKMQQIECLHIRGRGKRSDAMMQQIGPRKAAARRRFTRIALLSYLIKATSGDRLTLFAEIELHFPKLLPLARRLAEAHDARLKDAHTRDACAPNVIDMQTGRRRGAHRDPFAGVPEMFPLHELQRPA